MMTRTEDWEKIDPADRERFLEVFERADFTSLGGIIEYYLLEDDEDKTS